jgi:uncharacterized protein YqfB (UPF0267 family)
MENSPNSGTFTARLDTYYTDQWSSTYGTYVVGDIVNYEDVAYQCKLEHEAQYDRRPGGPQTDTYWLVIEDIEVNVIMHDPTITLRDTQESIFKDRPVLVTQQNDEWYLADIFMEPYKGQEIFEAVVQADASTGDTIEVKLKLEDDADEWAIDTLYNKEDFAINSGSLFKCIVGHVSEASNEAGVGVDEGEYWEEIGNFNVKCILVGVSNLNEATPRLAIGDSIFIKNFYGTWMSVNMFHAGGTGTGTIWAEVITMPTDPDATKEETDPLYSGLTYYTLRLLESSYNEWSGGQTYYDDSSTGGPTSYVTHPDTGELFKCIQEHTSNVGNMPSPHEDNPYWELQEEIRVNHVQGYGTSTVDMRNFVPRPDIGTYVSIIQKDGNYYFSDMLGYVGPNTNRSISWHEQEKRMFGCFK